MPYSIIPSVKNMLRYSAIALREGNQSSLIFVQKANTLKFEGSTMIFENVFGKF